MWVHHYSGNLIALQSWLNAVAPGFYCHQVRYFPQVYIFEIHRLHIIVMPGQWVITDGKRMEVFND